jgi:hypothetical protein
MKQALVSIDDPTRLHTDKLGKLGLSPITVSRSMTAASNSSMTAPDEADLSEVRSPINDRDQDTVSSATNDLGGQPAALGHRTSDIDSWSTSTSNPAAAISSPVAPAHSYTKKVKWARSVSQQAALSGGITSKPEASEEEVEA